MITAGINIVMVWNSNYIDFIDLENDFCQIIHLIEMAQ